MDTLIDIDVDELSPDPDQPRKDFAPDALQELATSIAAVGVKTAISIRKNPNVGDGERSYIIIAGERRWRAAKLANCATIPAILTSNDVELTDEDIYIHQLTENLHREDLNPVEKAEFLQRRLDDLKEKGVSNPTKKVAEELGVTKSWVSKNTTVLKYEPHIRALARDGKIRDYSVLKKVAGLPKNKQQLAIGMIEEGVFNAKEFFKRKRYDPGSTKETSEDQEANEESNSAEAETGFVIRLPLTSTDCINLINRTAYSSVLDEQSPEWRSSSGTILKNYVNSFKQWFSECDVIDIS